MRASQWSSSAPLAALRSLAQHDERADVLAEVGIRFTPIAIAAATAGWLASASSTSAGAMLVPALMMGSLARPAWKKRVVRVAVDEIAGAQPAIGIDRGRRRGRIAEVAAHDRGAAHQQLAGRSLRQRASVGADDLHLEAARAPQRADLAPRCARAD